MSMEFLRRVGLSLVAASSIGLLAAGVGGAADGGPLIIGGLNLGTPGGNITQLRAIGNGPAFYATNEWGNGVSAIAYPPYAIGVYGIHQSTNGTAPGVQGETYSPNGYGVLGLANSSNGGIGVVAHGYGGMLGTATGLLGVAVHGKAEGSNGIGVFGETTGETPTAYAVYGTSSPPGYAGYFQGNVGVAGTLSALTKNFKIDDPLDPAHKYLVHSSVESSELKNVYDGIATTDAKGFATVQLPRWFQVINKDFRYQLTSLSGLQEVAVAKEIAHNRFTIQSEKPNSRISWQVTGIRHDPYANAHPLTVEQRKPQAEQGKYLTPELYGKKKSAGIGRLP